MSHSFLCRCLVLVLLALGSLVAHPITPAAAAGQLRTEWPHLDCSACLAVAGALGERMNTSLASMPSSYLVSHRLDTDNNLRRRDYKRGELRGVEVLDKLCAESTLGSHFLRLNAKTKVRGFHIRDYTAARAGYRDVFEEQAFFPNASGPSAYFRSRLGGIRMPVAHFYNRRERLEMGKLVFYDAPRAVCTVFADEHDDELSAIVRELDWLTEVEEQLCGLNWGHVVANTRAQFSGDGQRWPGLPAPVSRVCMDGEAVRASARLDQRRWYAWSQKRRAEREAKSTRGAATGTPAVARPAEVVVPPRKSSEEAPAASDDGTAGDL